MAALKTPETYWYAKNIYRAAALSCHHPNPSVLPQGVQPCITAA
jgi:hypothetical protein